MPKVSVIVPVYNVSAYIERCARSLFEQTLDDIEYIFINDCTPDDSMTILSRVAAEYPNRRSQIRIFKMSTNSRQAAVRRQGIKLATGDYTIHCDSDDWVDANLYKKMYDEAIRSKADIVLCPIQDEYTDHHGRVRRIRSLPNNCREVLKNWYHKCIEMYAWNKLVKTSIYQKYDILPFEGINMWEDNGLFLRLFYYADGLSKIDDAFYHYNRGNSSAMTNGYGQEAVNQMIDCAKQIDIFFREKNDFQLFEKTDLALKFYARINLITDNFAGLKEYKSTFPESNKIIPQLKLDAFSLKGKIRFFAVKYKFTRLFVIFFKLKNMLFR